VSSSFGLCLPYLNVSGRHRTKDIVLKGAKINILYARTIAKFDRRTLQGMIGSFSKSKLPVYEAVVVQDFHQV